MTKTSDHCFSVWAFAALLTLVACAFAPAVANTDVRSKEAPSVQDTKGVQHTN